MKRIVLWGATGYTGALVAEALVGSGLPVTLAGRDAERLSRLRERLSGAAEWRVEVADASQPGSVAALVDADTVLVATVGPFTRFGWPAAQAAAESGAAYIDCTGEPPFLRRVHDTLAVPSARSGAMLAPAFGYDYVPGQVAAAYALRDAPEACGVRVGYFTSGRVGRTAASGGTLASMAAIAAEPSYAWRDGQLRQERAAARVLSMRVEGQARTGLSVGGAEHVFLPRTFPGLRTVDVYLGWAGSRSRWVQAFSAAAAPLTRMPGARRLVDWATRRLVRGSTGGPSVADRSSVTSRAVAEALDDEGAVLSRAELSGPNPYDLTAALLAAAAGRLCHERSAAPVGVVGPLELFGVQGMLDLAAEVGMRRTE